MTRKTIVSTLLSFSVLCSAAGTLQARPGDEADQRTAASKTQRRAADAEAPRQAVFAIQGMITKQCPKQVQSALASLPGVMQVSASLKDKSATVRFDAKHTNPREIIAAIEKQTPYQAYLLQIEDEVPQGR